MKSKPILILLLMGLTQYSCKNDDDLVMETNSIIGKWLRSDFTDSFEYQLFFENNGFGKIVNVVIDQGGIISSANPFTWSINNNILTLIIDGDLEIVTTINYNTSGNLILEDFSNLEFIRQ